MLTYDVLTHQCSSPFLSKRHPPTNPTPPKTDFTSLTPTASDQCNVLSPTLCRVVNADAYSLLLAVWASLQLTWVSMLLFVQFIQVARAMTTYENMFGVGSAARSGAALASAFTSTGAPLDPSSTPTPTSPEGGHGHGHGGHGHRHGGVLKHWGRLLGVDTFIETARGRGAATGTAQAGRRRRERNPFSQGCWANCKDFWCDPAPVFGKRETGAAVLGGAAVNYTEMYESPVGMESGGAGRRVGGYEAVGGEEV